MRYSGLKWNYAIKTLAVVQITVIKGMPAIGFAEHHLQVALSIKHHRTQIIFSFPWKK